MPEGLGSRTPHFGLRDFLFYFVPGGALLAGIVAVVDVTPAFLKEWGSVGESLVALFCAYFLGQVVYPITYPLRRWLAPKGEWSTKTSKEFAELHERALEEHAAYYAAVIFRDRSFARFALAMVVPSVFLGACLAFRLGWPLVILGLASAGGFLVRYKKYDKRYRMEVLLCTGEDFEPPSSMHALD